MKMWGENSENYEDDGDRGYFFHPLPKTKVMYFLSKRLLFPFNETKAWIKCDKNQFFIYF